MQGILEIILNYDLENYNNLKDLIEDLSILTGYDLDYLKEELDGMILEEVSELKICSKPTLN